ncbi:rRNA maturation RNase YbeY, partial [bacterium]|nr:rRNA maturation RNase YbeY [bacterium]
VNIGSLKKNARTILGLLDYHDFELNLFLTTNKTIRAYNKKFRSIDKPTDILSFPYHPDLQPGEVIIPKLPNDKHLGDIIISLEYVKEDIQKLKTTFAYRLQVLLVHGICHLIGYDHQTDAQYEQMQKIEKKLLEKITEKTQ